MAVLASSAAWRPEAQWDANDASGIRAAAGCGGVGDDASVTSHEAAFTAAHTRCGCPSEESRGFSFPKLVGEGKWAPESPWWNPAPTQSTLRSSLPDPDLPGLPAFQLSAPIAHPGSPRNRAYMVLCAPLPFLRWGSGSEPMSMLSFCQLGVPTGVSLTTSTFYLPVPFEHQVNTTLFSLASAHSELQCLRQTRTIRICPLRI